jgi:hypothetical protein
MGMFLCFTLCFTVYSFFSVNLGGLFVIEPFIVPSFFEKYPTAVDEWTLSEAMTADTSPGGGLSQLEDHYNTFIVRIPHAVEAFH